MFWQLGKRNNFVRHPMRAVIAKMKLSRDQIVVTNERERFSIGPSNPFARPFPAHFLDLASLVFETRMESWGFQIPIKRPTVWEYVHPQAGHQWKYAF